MPRTSRWARALLLTVTAAPSLLCHAESNVHTGAGAQTSIAHVDFQITIPKFIFLRVGTGTGTVTGGLGTNGTIDLITWSPASGTVGNGVALAGTGGDLGGGVETAVVIANRGNVTLTSSTLGALGDGVGDTISYAQIRTTASQLTTAQVLRAPALVDGGTRSVTVPAGGSKVVQRDAQWAYTYRNQTTPPPGSYGGVNTNNGRVTYTASVP
jgi:hypothetical protein